MAVRSSALCVARWRPIWLVILVVLVSTGVGTSAIAYDDPEPPTPIDFVRKDKIFLSPSGEPLTSIALGPDGRLYVSSLYGTIYGLTLDAAYNVVDVQQFDTIHDTPNFHEDGTPAPGIVGRLVLGITFDPESTPAQPIMYVSHSDPGISPDDPINVVSGTITRLTGPNFDTPANRLDVVTGLPRSRKNHATNSILFGPDGWLYIAQGGNTDLGTAHVTWGNLPEFYLSAAILRANVRGMQTPVDVSDVATAADLVPLQGQFELYATGFRNAYDLVWHSSGDLYVNENGANVFQGTTPGPQHGCPNGEAILPANQNDALFVVGQGMHGGHPNPARGQCIFRDGSLYNPPKPPDPNFQPPLREYAYNLGEVSMDGIAEYPVGAMAGNLISATFSGTELLVRIILNPDGSATIARIHEYGAFDNPLDLVIDDEGTIYIAEFGLDGNAGVSLLIPESIATPELTLTGVSPNTGPVEGGTAVTLSGTLFASGATVSFGGIPATNVTVVNDTTITATTPAHAAGAVAVSVTNPDGQSDTLTGAFIYTSGGGGASLVRVNSGGGGYSGSTGFWEGDTNFSGGGTYSTGSAIANTTDDELYQSERYGDFSYTFNLENGNYLVTLKFAENYWTSPGQRVFDVALNGQTVLDDFDILSETAPLTALDKSFPANVSNNTLTIGFTTAINNAKISAIEITSSGDPDTTPPTVSGTDPPDGATDVALDSTVSVTFSEPMNQASVEAAFDLAPSHTGNFSWNPAGTTMTFTPLAAISELRPNTLYTVTVDGAAADLAGNPLGNPAVWTFTTTDDDDTTPPTVTGNSPLDGAANVPLASAISVTFSEPMNQAVTEAAFNLTPSHTGSFSWGPTGTTLTFTPSGGLIEGQSYTAGIAASASDQAGNLMGAPHSWDFTTISGGSAPPPTLTSISPTSGPTTGGASVTLSGDDFAIGATVSFGGSPATNVTVVDSTTITASTPAHVAGAVAVTVTNPDGQSDTLTGAFTYTTGGGGGASLVRVNAGGGGYTDGAGEFWSGDNGFSGGGSYSTGSAIANTTDDELYQSERYGNFSYAFNLTNGDYLVTLKFAEIFWTSPGQRVFDVAFNGQVVLNNFDILSETNRLVALDKSIPVSITTGTLTISFTTITDNAKISAIEISSGGGGGDTTPPSISTTNPLDGATDVAVNSSISVTFSEPMNQASAEAAFSLTPSHTGAFSWNPAGTTMTFTPADDLLEGEVYTAGVSTGATDLAGNPLGSVHGWDFTTADSGGGDTTPPVVSADPQGGTYQSTQSVTLSANEAATIYYTTDGSTPNESSSEYAAPIEISVSTTLRFFGVDTAGNASSPVTENYVIDVADPPPSLTNVAPTSGPTTGGTSVTLSGTGFATGATVTFGGSQASQVVVVDSTTITATTPAHAAGTVAVSVTNPDGQSDTLTGAFTYTSGGGGGTSLVRINAGGSGYTDTTGEFWDGDTGASGGGTYTTGSAIANTTDDELYQSERFGNFSYTFNLSNGDYLVTLKFAEIYWTSPGQRVFDVALNGQLVLNNFDILSETNRLVALDKSFPVNVTSGTLTITFVTEVDNAKVAAIEIVSSGGGGDTTPAVNGTNPLDGATNVALDSTISVTFSEPMDEASVEAAFSLTPSHTGGFSWNPAGTTMTFNPTGDLLEAETYTASVSTGATDLAGNALASATSWDFTTTSGGGAPAPTLTDISPSSGPTSGGASVTLDGSNFVAGATVDFDGTAATNVVVVNSSTITADTPAHSDGSVSVTVTNPDGQSDTIVDAFTYTTSGGGDGEWTQMPPLPEARGEVGVVEAGGKIYVLGGGSQSQENNDVFAFDPVAGTWSEVAPYPGSAIDHAGAASVNGIVYMIGGLIAWPDQPVDTVYAYDPDTDTWTQKASLPSARGAMGVTVLGGKIYAVGGLVSGGTAVADLAVYDPQTDTWTELAPMPTPRDHLVAEAANGRVFAIGGRPVSINSILATNEAYNPATNTWESRAPMPTARGGLGSAVLDGKIIVFGGEGNIGSSQGTFSETEEYDPASNTWRSLAPMITARHGTDGAVFNGVIYVPGGGPNQGGSSSTVHEAFSLISGGGNLTHSGFALVGFLSGWVVWSLLWRSGRYLVRRER